MRGEDRFSHFYKYKGVPKMHVLFSKQGRLILIVAVCLLLSIGITHAQEGGLYDSEQAANIPPDFAIEWINTLYARIEADGINAPAASRLYGYATVSLYEASLPGMSDNNTLIGQIASLTDLPWPTEDAIHDWPAVVDIGMDFGRWIC
jgi:hypothetical protein